MYPYSTHYTQCYLQFLFGKKVLLTGPVLPEEAEGKLEENWANWLDAFANESIVYCAFGSQINLEKDQFQELLLGFELSGLPFLVALKTPRGCESVEEALPEGFEERVKGRGASLWMGVGALGCAGAELEEFPVRAEKLE